MLYRARLHRATLPDGHFALSRRLSRYITPTYVAVVTDTRGPSTLLLAGLAANIVSRFDHAIATHPDWRAATTIAAP